MFFSRRAVISRSNDKRQRFFKRLEVIDFHEAIITLFILEKTFPQLLTKWNQCFIAEFCALFEKNV